MSTNNFIVVFKDNATPEQIAQYKEQVNGGGGEVTHEYGTVLKGFAAKLTSEQFSSFTSLVDDGPIKYIEPDGVVTTQ
ncbi:hypothetical protein BKA62DRAFT_705578 [Auriculariales sp. MPI-PUGE-AT-0066]|nr:hypothetical protein BKA62DRAFT_705578 [Auriculariales sp. MPI-PUGE-AT-0066]